MDQIEFNKSEYYLNKIYRKLFQPNKYVNDVLIGCYELTILDANLFSPISEYIASGAFSPVFRDNRFYKLSDGDIKDGFRIYKETLHKRIKENTNIRVTPAILKEIMNEQRFWKNRWDIFKDRFDGRGNSNFLRVMDLIGDYIEVLGDKKKYDLLGLLESRLLLKEDGNVELSRLLYNEVMRGEVCSAQDKSMIVNMFNNVEDWPIRLISEDAHISRLAIAIIHGKGLIRERTNMGVYVNLNQQWHGFLTYFVRFNHPKISNAKRENLNEILALNGDSV